MNADEVDVRRVAVGEELRPTAGVDWAKDDHAVVVVVVDADGRETARRTQPQTAAGITGLVRFLQAKGVQEVAIERPTGKSSTPCSRPGSPWW